MLLVDPRLSPTNHGAVWVIMLIPHLAFAITRLLENDQSEARRCTPAKLHETHQMA